LSDGASLVVLTLQDEDRCVDIFDMADRGEASVTITHVCKFAVQCVRADVVTAIGRAGMGFEVDHCA
jgi:hypothetical protein